MTVCFYVEAICDDFETVIFNLDREKIDVIMSEIISAVNLQTHASK